MPWPRSSRELMYIPRPRLGATTKNIVALRFPERKLRLGRGVRWLSYPDGLVVYVDETCEMHLLPIVFAPLLNAPAEAVIVEGSEPFEAESADRVYGGQLPVSRNVITEMLTLKILTVNH